MVRADFRKHIYMHCEQPMRPATSQRCVVCSDAKVQLLPVLYMRKAVFWRRGCLRRRCPGKYSASVARPSKDPFWADVLLRGSLSQGAWNPEELVCPGCAAGDAAQICPKHGTDFLEYKCRYCCSVAVWFCFGTRAAKVILVSLCNFARGGRNDTLLRPLPQSLRPYATHGRARCVPAICPR